jgi:branched-chain amino acid transport system substrate-binding protein
MPGRKIVKMAAWALGLLLLAAPAGRAAPIRIGLTLGLTGRYAVIASMQERAFRLWATTTNRQGGILGRPVDLTIYDDQSDANTARALYQHMITVEKLDLLFPPYSSGLTTAILPISEAHGYPMLIHGAAADSIWQQGYRYAFGVLPPASRYTLGFMEMLLMNGITKVAVVSMNDAFSETIAKGSDLWIDRLGIKLVLRRILEKEPQDLDAVAREVQASHAQALIMCGHFNEAIRMRQALIDIHWYPKAYWASVGPVFQSYYDHFGPAAENTFASTQWTYYDKLPFPGSKAFYDSFLAAYGQEPSYHAASAYTAGVLLAAAIRTAGSIDRNRIRDVLASMDMMTLLGRYGVDRTGMQTQFFQLTIQWIDGRKEVVWPEELSTAHPRFP